MEDLVKNIKRYRLMRGMDQDRISGLLGISRVTYSKIENGRVKISDDMFYQFSRVLGVSPEALLDISMPRSKCLHRHKTTQTLQQRACSEQMQLDAERRLSDYGQLESMMGECQECSDQLKAFRHPVGSDQEAQQLGTDVRKLFFQQGFVQVCRFGEAIEANGVRFIPFDFPSSDEFGFTLRLEDGSFGIAVNTQAAISGERQLFTLCHELGHVLMHLDETGSDVLPDREREKKMERQAQAFASGLLMPEAEFDAFWQSTEGLLWFNRVLEVKKHFSVSYQTVIYRLDQKYRASTKKKTVPPYRVWFRQNYQRRFGRELPSREEACPSDVHVKSVRYLRLARKAFLDGKISMSRLAELLGKSILETRSIANDWSHEEEVTA